MKNLIKAMVLASALQLVPLANLSAAAPKTYQVTGPVLELTDSTIVVQKGDERWEIARDQNTRVEGTLKVGAKVTIQYRMVAASVEIKAEKGDAKKKAK